MGAQCAVGPRHAQIAAAHGVRNLGFVEEPNSQVVYEVGRMLLLGGVGRVLAAPAHKSGPARKLGEHARLVLLVPFLRDLEPLHERNHSLGRILGKRGSPPFGATRTQEPQRPVGRRQGPPGLVEPFAAAGHAPAGQPLVQESR